MLKSVVDSAIRRTISSSRLSRFSTATQPQVEERLQTFRTKENNPVNHTSAHIGQFYQLDPTEKKHLFAHGGMPRTFDIQSKTFNETCILIRQPGVDLINCLKNLDYSKPAVRFVLYGKKGTGKSLILAHVLHYAYKDNFLIIHVPWLGNWMRRCKESSNSETKEGYIDLNIDAAAWLTQFKSQNSHLLTNPDFKTSQDYVWSKRETTPQGSPLLTLIDHGINRIKYASNCVICLANEIKKLSREGVCKTLVAVDGYNAFFYPKTRILTDKKEIVHPSKITLTEAFLSLSKFDWNNAAIVVTVDEIAIAEEDQISHMPRYLLGKDGFEHLDPFVPVLVDKYTTKEFTSVLNYYRERKWITPFPGHDEELSGVSANNPYYLMNVCSAL